MPTFLPARLVAVAFGLSIVPSPVLAASNHLHPSAHKTDALQSRLSARLHTIEGKLSAARKAGRIGPAKTAQLSKKLAWVRADAAKYGKEQGFLSAGESASYNRALDEVERTLR
ncbi:hypothetical protein [Novosphingobium gossypii]|uniref:hypothetical protein n=1 Tax=Novosphingobium gossypii TaxID=1604774 RepID=UPI003D20F8EF